MEAPVRIADVLKNKGAGVLTVTPETTVSDLLSGLVTRNVGAMVVVGPDGLVGIVSERDVVRMLHEHGAAVLGRPVADIMTSQVITCYAGGLGRQPQRAHDDPSGASRARHGPRPTGRHRQHRRRREDPDGGPAGRAGGVGGVHHPGLNRFGGQERSDPGIRLGPVTTVEVRPAARADVGALSRTLGRPSSTTP